MKKTIKVISGENHKWWHWFFEYWFETLYYHKMLFNDKEAEVHKYCCHLCNWEKSITYEMEQ
jgi:hypothetical protein